MSKRSGCEYCKGNTKIDDYGNCKACGAPKPFYDEKTATPLAGCGPGDIWPMQNAVVSMSTCSPW